MSINVRAFRSSVSVLILFTQPNVCFATAAEIFRVPFCYDVYEVELSLRVLLECKDKLMV
jgi:hypothetical protein